MVDNCSITARLGARKWAPRYDYLIMPYRLAGTKVPEAEAIARCESILKGRGVRVRIGG